MSLKKVMMVLFWNSQTWLQLFGCEEKCHGAHRFFSQPCSRILRINIAIQIKPGFICLESFIQTFTIRSHIFHKPLAIKETNNMVFGSNSWTTCTLNRNIFSDSEPTNVALCKETPLWTSLDYWFLKHEHSQAFFINLSIFHLLMHPKHSQFPYVDMSDAWLIWGVSLPSLAVS